MSAGRFLKSAVSLFLHASVRCVFQRMFFQQAAALQPDPGEGGTDEDPSGRGMDESSGQQKAVSGI